MWKYYLRAAELGCPLISEYGIYRTDPQRPIKGHHLEIMQFLQEAEEKGVTDERVLVYMIRLLAARGKEIQKGSNPSDLALQYCEVLINRGSPLGYHWKGTIYCCDDFKDWVKAVSIWEDADRLGVASFYTYSQGGLVTAYTYVHM